MLQLMHRYELINSCLYNLYWRQNKRACFIPPPYILNTWLTISVIFNFMVHRVEAFVSSQQRNRSIIITNFSFFIPLHISRKYTWFENLIHNSSKIFHYNYTDVLGRIGLKNFTNSTRVRIKTISNCFRVVYHQF